jgi:hypothetical protein
MIRKGSQKKKTQARVKMPRQLLSDCRILTPASDDGEHKGFSEEIMKLHLNRVDSISEQDSQ